MLRTALFAALLCLGCAARAETLYVTDVLRLGLHRASDTSDTPFDSLVSGAALEILERAPNYARVRTAEGAEGWVKSNYLVAELPARTRAAELEHEVATLRAKLESAHAARAGAEAALERETNGAPSVDALQAALEQLRHDNAGYEARLETYRASLPLPWVGAALLVASAAGFVAGLWWLDALIRRRHGGFRVY